MNAEANIEVLQLENIRLRDHKRILRTMNHSLADRLREYRGKLNRAADTAEECAANSTDMAINYAQCGVALAKSKKRALLLEAAHAQLAGGDCTFAVLLRVVLRKLLSVVGLNAKAILPSRPVYAPKAGELYGRTIPRHVKTGSTVAGLVEPDLSLVSYYDETIAELQAQIESLEELRNPLYRPPAPPAPPAPAELPADGCVGASGPSCACRATQPPDQQPIAEAPPAAPAPAPAPVAQEPAKPEWPKYFVNRQYSVVWVARSAEDLGLAFSNGGEGDWESKVSPTAVKHAEISGTPEVTKAEAEAYLGRSITF